MRSILNDADTKTVANALQGVLVTLIDLSLVGKQAHWMLRGPEFKGIHEHLDLIIDAARLHSDAVAERMVTIGAPADGRAAAVAADSAIAEYPAGFITTAQTVSLVSDALHTTIAGLRKGIAAVEKPDPVSQDLLIGIAAELEKHLWLLQSRES